jgi:hypothetical protein
MRAIIVGALLVSLIAARPADACGGGGGMELWQPRAFVIAKHGAHRFIRFGGTRSVAAKDQLRWRRAANLERPLTLTLVGPAGTKVITTRESWWFTQKSQRTHNRIAQRGIRIDVNGDYTHAYEGDVTAQLASGRFAISMGLGSYLGQNDPSTQLGSLEQVRSVDGSRGIGRQVPMR